MIVHLANNSPSLNPADVFPSVLWPLDSTELFFNEFDHVADSVNPIGNPEILFCDFVDS